MARKPGKSKDNTAIIVAIIAASAALLAAIIGLATPFVERMASENTPTPVAVSTPLSGRIPFTSPVNSGALHEDLQWDAGSSEASLFTLSTEIIRLTAGPYTWPNFPAIYYTQPIEGNFDTQVKIKFHPSQSTTYMAGLVIRPINARLAMGDSSFPMDWVVSAKYLTDVGDLVGCRGSWADTEGDTIYLRIERDDDAWRCAYGENGVNWMRLKTEADVRALNASPLEIALFAYSDANDSITVEFSDWIITRR